jgi:hypothetical protein
MVEVLSEPATNGVSAIRDMEGDAIESFKASPEAQNRQNLEIWQLGNWGALRRKMLNPMILGKASEGQKGIAVENQNFELGLRLKPDEARKVVIAQIERLGDGGDVELAEFGNLAAAKVDFARTCKRGTFLNGELRDRLAVIDHMKK